MDPSNKYVHYRPIEVTNTTLQLAISDIGGPHTILKLLAPMGFPARVALEGLEGHRTGKEEEGNWAAPPHNSGLTRFLYIFL